MMPAQELLNAQKVRLLLTIVQASVMNSSVHAQHGGHEGLLPACIVHCILTAGESSSPLQSATASNLPEEREGNRFCQ